MARSDRSREISLFLDDDQVGPEIRRLTTGARLRCAVAFWGDGAAQGLFEGSPPSDARLICDVSMGGSNPRELRSIGAPNNMNLRHLHGLHAKVYISQLGLITSSSNASNHGIGFIESARLIEAGTFHYPGSAAYKQAAEWFERIWRHSIQIDEATLQLADESWRRKSRINTYRPNREVRPDSLLDVVVADPGRFRGVGFVFASGQPTREERDETAGALIEEDNERATPVLTNLDRADICEWNLGDVFSNWGPQEIWAWPLRFILIHKRRNNTISYWFYERVHFICLPGDRGMLFGRRSRNLRRELGFPKGCRQMANVDQNCLQAIFNHIGEDGNLYESGTLLAHLLADIGFTK